MHMPRSGHGYAVGVVVRYGCAACIIWICHAVCAMGICYVCAAYATHVLFMCHACAMYVLCLYVLCMCHVCAMYVLCTAAADLPNIWPGLRRACYGYAARTRPNYAIRMRGSAAGMLPQKMPWACHGHAIICKPWWVCRTGAMNLLWMSGVCYASVGYVLRIWFVCAMYVRGRPRVCRGSTVDSQWVRHGSGRVCYGYATDLRRVCDKYDMLWVSYGNECMWCFEYPPIRVPQPRCETRNQC